VYLTETDVGLALLFVAGVWLVVMIAEALVRSRG
jgi:hypothetical protein